MQEKNLRMRKQSNNIFGSFYFFFPQPLPPLIPPQNLPKLQPDVGQMAMPATTAKAPIAMADSRAAGRATAALSSSVVVLEGLVLLSEPDMAYSWVVASVLVPGSDFAPC